MSGRCLSCNCKMNDFEMTRKYAESGKYVDLCSKCLGTIHNFPEVVERQDLQHVTEIEEEEQELT